MMDTCPSSGKMSSRQVAFRLTATVYGGMLPKDSALHSAPMSGVERVIRHITRPLAATVLLLVGCASLRPPAPGGEERNQIETAAEARFDRGVDYYDASQYERAVVEFGIILEEYEISERADDAAYMLSLSYFALERYDGAIAYATRIGRDFPSSPFFDDALLILAQSYVEEERYVPAATAYMDLIERSTDEVLLEQGRDALQRLIETRLARSELRELVNRPAPADVRGSLLFNLGSKELSAGHRERGRAYLERYLQHYPDGEYASRAEALIGADRPPALVQPRRVGVLAPLTGRYSDYGKAVREGVELATEEFNQVNRAALSLIIGDTHGDPVDALRTAQQLIDDEGVIALIGPVLSSSTIAVAGLANARGVPLISPTATEQRISTIGQYIFQLNPSSTDQGRAIGAFATEEMGLQKLAILHPSDTYGYGVASSFREGVRRGGGTIVAEESYDLGTTDFSENILNIRGAEPEAVFIPGFPDEIILIAPQLRYYDVEAQLLGSDGWNSERVVLMGEQYVEGAVFVVPQSNEGPSIATSGFAERYRRRYGSAANATAALGYDAMAVLAECLAYGPTDREGLRVRLEEFGARAGASGIVTLRARIRDPGYRFFMIREGNIVEVERGEEVMPVGREED